MENDQRPRAEGLEVPARSSGWNACPCPGAGHLACRLQHETDHLDGVLFIDRLDRDRRKAATRMVARMPARIRAARRRDVTSAP